MLSICGRRFLTYDGDWWRLNDVGSVNNRSTWRRVRAAVAAQTGDAATAARTTRYVATHSENEINRVENFILKMKLIEMKISF
ncbi:unnamed protein product [Danaus chrysippus]|uniref:(African queen) hypothetical protein n=1 Tax=Danaus chrysippus TaxID=151541 RepID=A0A8J2WB83_9NEOP|nr:unnamed protein product [Danaus chrysippus]